MTQKEWQLSATKLAGTGVLSWREIAETLRVPKSTVSDFLRKYTSFLDSDDLTPLAKAAYDNSRILFISDMHIPYQHKGLLPFLEGLKTRYEPTRVICLGDELDKHA